MKVIYTTKIGETIIKSDVDDIPDDISTSLQQEVIRIRMITWAGKISQKAYKSYDFQIVDHLETITEDSLQENKFFIDGRLRPDQTVFWLEYADENTIEVIEGFINSINVSTQSLKYYCTKTGEHSTYRVLDGIFIYTNREEAEKALQIYRDGKEKLHNIFD